MLSSDQIKMAEKLDLNIEGEKKKLCLTLLTSINVITATFVSTSTLEWCKGS